MSFNSAEKLVIIVNPKWPNLDFAERKIESYIDTLQPEKIDVLSLNDRARQLNDQIQDLCGQRRLIQMKQKDEIDEDQVFDEGAAVMLFDFGDDNLYTEEELESKVDLLFVFDKSDLNLADLSNNNLSVDGDEVVYEP